jgi:uncharacterized protein YegP (UPF0339 family)
VQEGSKLVAESKPKRVVYRDLKDGYRWMLRSPMGETLAASPSGHREKSACEAEVRAVMTGHPGAEVLDPTTTETVS